MTEIENLCQSIESALAESEQRFQQMAEMTGEWLWEQDPNGYYIYSSIAVKQILGFNQIEIIGKHYTELLTPEDKSNQQFYADHQEPFYALTNRYCHKDGHQVLTESTGLPIISQDGRLMKWRGVDRDITARKAAEEQIHEAQIELAVAQREIKIAQQIQTSLLPRAPIASSQFEIAGVCLPADQVGGDYFDYFYRNQNCLDLVIADVSGHAIGPALFMVEARSIIRSQAQNANTPGATLELLNSFLFDDLNRADYFISLFYLQYNVLTKQLSFANAGHPLPLLYNHALGTCSRLDTEGLILGVRNQVVFQEKSVTLAQGDILLLYTDGITETENKQGEFFGEERLATLFQQNAQQPAQVMIDVLLNQVKQFCNFKAFNDDITLLVFKCL
ncbi:MAG: SpoIIE family protein phosphatase [Methylococcaceae bacterium]